MKKRLVVLSPSFGVDFSGGSRATCEMISEIQHHFSTIEVVTKRVGTHRIENLVVHNYANTIQAFSHIARLRRADTIFYGDFFDAILLVIARVNFVFTYHDNWPELSKLSYWHQLQNVFYSSVYRIVFRCAQHLVTVSRFKADQLQKHRKEVHYIPNGFRRSSDLKIAEPSHKVVMVGNIDARKYKLAIALFRLFDPVQVSFQVEVFGHKIDKRVYRQLKAFPFVHLKGFEKEVPYSKYKVLLHTSYTESFGMVFCEAIAQRVPVLTFGGSGASEIINERNGVLVAQHDLQSLKRRLMALLEKPFLADPLSVDHFSWGETARKYVPLFENT